MIDRVRAARRDPDLAVLEGFHALKHALRFGAEVEAVVATDLDDLERLARELAPDLAGRFRDLAVEVTPEEMRGLAPIPPRTGVVAIARRSGVDVDVVLADPRPAPVVLLADPRDLGNLGAAVRVAAAADAAGVITTGALDPWDPAALRGSAGLHYALPVARVEVFEPRGRPLLAVDPEGEELGAIPERAVLAFGSERHGLSGELLARADGRVRIPMRAGVSSLNLATAVAVVLFARS
jgi:TrmH family RNA methyltransferase